MRFAFDVDEWHVDCSDGLMKKSMKNRLQIERSLLKRFSCLLFFVWLQSPTVLLASTHTNIWRFWAGGWPHVTSIGGLNDEQAADRSFLLAGFGYSRILRQNHTASIRYCLDIILADTQMPIVSEVSQNANLKESVYGLGLMPVGLQWNFRPSQHLQPFANLSAGFVKFQKSVPLADETKLNFALEAGAGVEYHLGRFSAVHVGIKLHHISNGGTGHANPGINSAIPYAGITIFNIRRD